jgi:hypothetical protein
MKCQSRQLTKGFTMKGYIQNKDTLWLPDAYASPPFHFLLQ